MTRRRLAFEKSSGNVFADLGFDRPDEELTKARLILEIVQLIRGRGLTQTAAGHLLGLPQPKVSLLFHGKVAGFSTDRLVRLLTRLGQDVDIVIRAKSTARQAGRVRVVGRGLAAAR
jgi:predicted XRE-type DNA-binding protein